MYFYFHLSTVKNNAKFHNNFSLFLNPISLLTSQSPQVTLFFSSITQSRLRILCGGAKQGTRNHEILILLSRWGSPEATAFETGSTVSYLADEAGIEKLEDKSSNLRKTQHALQEKKTGHLQIETEGLQAGREVVRQEINYQVT